MSASLLFLLSPDPLTRQHEGHKQIPPPDPRYQKSEGKSPSLASRSISRIFFAFLFGRPSLQRRPSPLPALATSAGRRQSMMAKTAGTAERLDRKCVRLVFKRLATRRFTRTALSQEAVIRVSL